MKTETRVPWFALLVSVFVWGELVYKLRLDWATNAQYEFGPFVPILIAILVFQNWKQGGPSTLPRSAAPLWAGLACLLLILLPMRIVQEANPEWRPLNWVHASVVIAITYLVLVIETGWGQARRLASPLFLIFLALPWPLYIEQTVIQSLARAVAEATAELLNFSGVPAVSNGNVVVVPTGPVGIADACSGVRSVAGTLMAAFFFGIFYRLRLPAKLALLALGLASAFLFNLVRTFTLSWIVATKGVSALDQWHDNTGLLIFVASFAVLWLTAMGLENWTGFVPLPAFSVPQVRPVTKAALAGALVWLCAVEVLTESWYQMRERHLPHFASWLPNWGENDPRLRFVPVTDEARAILRYSEGSSAVLAEPGLSRWQIFFFRWASGRSSAQLAVLHRPDICLPAAGLKSLGRGKSRTLDAVGTQIPFESFLFRRDDAPVFVFRTLREERRPPGAVSAFDQSLRGRLASAWAGYRNLGQRLLQISIEGARNEDAAFEDLRARLPHFLQPAE